MTIALTSGEPSGIGPDIAIIYAQKERTENLMVYADPDALIERAKLLKLPLILKESSTNKAGELSIFPIKSKEKTVPGQLNPNNAEYVLSIIKQATHDCLNKTCNGILTGPINKAVINQAGIKFSGHTEYLAELSNCQKTVMLLATKKLKVALATTHLALKDVPKNITKESLTEVIAIINKDLSNKSIVRNSKNWKFILNKSKLSAHKKHVFKKFLIKRDKENYLKINIYPDGGISRIRAFGNFVK